MPDIKAVIFDMDGVLIDAKDWHYEALNRALGLFGYTISRYDHLVTFDGLPTRKKLEMLSKEQFLPEGLHPLINELKQIYTTEMVHAQCKPRFQHEYALSRLKAEGYKLGVASNSIRRSVELMMDRSALMPFLDSVVSNEDVEKAKPDPEIYIKAMAELGVKPEETLVLEDNENGIASAKAAGAHLMKIVEVTDVTYPGIRQHIDLYEGKA
ncbi:MAG: HAD family hydrolase [Opitutales bacterium]